MAEFSKIEWTDHTFNPWWGCTRISDACDFCYAADLSKRWGFDVWDNSERRKIKDWSKPLKWEKNAAKFFEANGRRQRVFSASMADIFDNQVPEEWRAEFWELVRKCPSLDWQILTKRPMNIRKMLPDFWDEIRGSIWLGTTVENQEAADRNIPHLLMIDSAYRFLSCEPLLGSIDITNLVMPYSGDAAVPPGAMQQISALTKNEIFNINNQIDWVISGGESGPKARPTDPAWFYSIQEQCEKAGVPFFFKQWGAFNEAGDRVGKKKSGRILQGKEYSEFPVAW